MSLPPTVLDLIIAALILFMTYVVSSEGAWGNDLRLRFTVSDDAATFDVTVLQHTADGRDEPLETFYDLSGTLTSERYVGAVLAAESEHLALDPDPGTPPGSITAITTSATLPNGRKNAASTGGSLTISNLRVDLATLSVFADITGAKGVGSQNLALWGITSHTSSGTVVTAPDAIVGAVATINSLSLTVDGYNAFAQSLGLTKFGKDALAAATTFGTITTAVPEPSGWALAVAGMAGIGMMKRRRASSTH